MKKITKYYLYVRKSTEDEERQVMSIEAQLTELNDLARREGIKILETFIESKSAKKPGREIFNQMIEKIYASKEPVGILSWHPDRLARNSVDGGQIIYLIDIAKIGSLKFPTFWFEPTPQGLFMLQVAFGQSKYYSDNLSENVKRGIRQKIRRGEYPTLAPIGYVNNANTRNIELVDSKAKIIKQAFEEYAEGRHSLSTLSQRLHFLGLMSKTGRLLPKQSVARILTNPTYMGLLKFKGEFYEGKFEPIVSQATFEAVQKELKKKSKSRKQKPSYDFPFTGLFKCGECGGMITAQYAKKRKYLYYRCTKQMGIKCSQPYLQDKLLLAQIKEALTKVALPKNWSETMLSQIDKLQKEDVQEQVTFCQKTETQLKEVETKLDKLVGSYLDGIIDQPAYLKKKEEFLKTKLELQEKLSVFGKKGGTIFELSRDCVKTALYADKLASSEDLTEIRSFLKKTHSNRILKDKKVRIIFAAPFDILSKYRSFKQKTPQAPCGVDLLNDAEVASCRADVVKALANSSLTIKQLGAERTKIYPIGLIHIDWKCYVSTGF